MSDRDAKIDEIKRLRKIEEIKRLRAERETGAADPAIDDQRVENQARVRRMVEGSRSSPMDAATKGVTSGFLYDWGDELEGSMTSKSLSGPEHDRAVERARLQEDDAANQYPTIYGASKLAGQVANPLTWLGGRSIPGAFAGAAAYGAGSSERSARTDPAGLVEDAAISGGIGAATQGAFNHVAGKLSPATAREVAALRANKAVSGEQVRDLRIQAKKAPRDAQGNVIPEGMRDESEMIGGRLIRRGEDLLERDEAGAPVVGLGDKWSNSYQKATAKERYFGGKVDEALSVADDHGVTVDGRDIAARIMAIADSLPENPNTTAIIDRLTETAAHYESLGRMPMSAAQSEKSSWVYKPENAQKVGMGQQVVNGVNRSISNAMEDAMTMASATPGIDKETAQLFSRYKLYKSKTDSFRSAGEAGKEQATRELNRRAVSPSDHWMGGLAGAASFAHGASPVKSMVVAGGMAALNHLARERGSSVGARLAWRVYQMAKAGSMPAKYLGPLADAAQKGGARLLLVDSLLKKDPIYAKIMEGEEP